MTDEYNRDMPPIPEKQRKLSDPVSTDPNVLIAAPFWIGDTEFLDNWLWWCEKQNTHKKYKLMLCVNGQEAEGIRQASEYIHAVAGDRVFVKVIEPMPDTSVNARLARARDEIRRFALSYNFDYVFFLDLDTVPLIRDAIPMLIAHKKHLTSGLYFYKNQEDRAVCSVYADRRIGLQRALTVQEMHAWLGEKKNIGTTIRLGSMGFGCALVSIDLLTVLGFRYFESRDLVQGEDVAYCVDAERQHDAPPFLDPRIVCKHLKKTDVAHAPQRD